MVDEVFGLATGYLGWSPHDAWHTPVPQILLALDYRVDWARKTNPFGGSEPEPKQPRTPATPAQIKAAFEAYGTVKVSDEQ